MQVILSGNVVSVPWKGRLMLPDEDWRSTGWVRTPWWHPLRWLGYSMREWVYDDSMPLGKYDGEWKYQTYLQRAHVVLKEKYDVN